MTTQRPWATHSIYMALQELLEDSHIPPPKPDTIGMCRTQKPIITSQMRMEILASQHGRRRAASEVMETTARVKALLKAVVSV